MSQRFFAVIIALAIFVYAFSSVLNVRASPNAAPNAGSKTIFLPFVARAPVSGPTLGGCAVFPSDSIFNRRIDALPVHANSNTYINFIGAGTGLHPDFGSGTWNGGAIGIPYLVVPITQTPVAIHYVEFGSESDPGPFPIPNTAPVEYGSDHHVLVVQSGSCNLFELYHGVLQANSSWNAGSGAKWNLGSNALRTAGWTSADAAGLPMLPLLARYDEVAAGEIKHAIRFTIRATNGTYIWPARHLTPSSYSNAPPMGQRFRLKSSVTLSGFSHDTQVILTAFQRYGIIMADNGSDWYISGAPDSRWNDSSLVSEFRQIHGSDFEAVDESSLMIDPNSGQSR